MEMNKEVQCGYWNRLVAVALAMAMLTAATADATTTKGNGLPPAVIWYAPFLSGGGYCSEAHSYVEAIDLAIESRRHDDQKRREESHHEKANAGDAHLHSAGSSSGEGATVAKQQLPFHLLVAQHGDSHNAAYIGDMTEEMRALLESHWVEERDFHWRLKDTKVALAICHSEPGAWYPAHYKTSRCPPEQAMYTVGRTMFETDRVPNGWTERMNKMDEIWVPTKFQQKIFVDGGVRADSIHVLPEAVDIHFFNPEKEGDVPYDLAAEISSMQVTATTTVFLSIFKWEERKAWRVLLKAYFETFTKDDDVVLAILTSVYHGKSETAKDFEEIIAAFVQDTLGKRLEDLPLVHVLSPHLPQHQLPALYKAATAFVLPSRGEGWGRPHVEAMAMGLPVIATFWSGTTEYMTDDNSYPVHIDGLTEIQEGAFRGHKWAEPSIAHLSELMQRVTHFPDEARAKGKQARLDMVTKYSPEVIGKIVLAHIERVLAIVATRVEDKPHDEL